MSELTLRARAGVTEQTQSSVQFWHPSGRAAVSGPAGLWKVSVWPCVTSAQAGLWSLQIQGSCWDDGGEGRGERNIQEGLGNLGGAWPGNESLSEGGGPGKGGALELARNGQWEQLSPLPGTGPSPCIQIRSRWGRKGHGERKCRFANHYRTLKGDSV